MPAWHDCAATMHCSQIVTVSVLMMRTAARVDDADTERRCDYCVRDMSLAAVDDDIVVQMHHADTDLHSLCVQGSGDCDALSSVA